MALRRKYRLCGALQDRGYGSQVCLAISKFIAGGGVPGRPDLCYGCATRRMNEPLRVLVVSGFRGMDGPSAWVVEEPLGIGC